jgi:hypothetical protein
MPSKWINAITFVMSNQIDFLHCHNNIQNTKVCQRQKTDYEVDGKHPFLSLAEIQHKLNQHFQGGV